MEPQHDPQQYQQQMDDWLVRQLDQERAVMTPPPPKEPKKPSTGLLGAGIIWGIGLAIICFVNSHWAGSTSSVMGAVSIVVMLFCLLLSLTWLGGKKGHNEVLAAKAFPAQQRQQPAQLQRPVLYPGQSAPAGTRAWFPTYKAGALPGMWVICGWEPVIVGLNGALYYERYRQWRNPAEKKSYRKPQWGPALEVFLLSALGLGLYGNFVGSAPGVPQGLFILGFFGLLAFFGFWFWFACKHPTGFKILGWIFAADYAARAIHNAHVRHDARIYAEEMNRK